MPAPSAESSRHERSPIGVLFALGPFLLNLGLVTGVVLASGYIDYLDGATNTAMFAGIPLGRVLLYLIAFCIMIACLAVALLCMCLTWGKTSRGGRVLSLCQISLVLLGMAMAMVLRPLGATRFQQGVEKWVGANANIPGIRRWAQGVPASPPPFGLVSKAQWPPDVIQLEPVIVTTIAGSPSAVQINWGGGFIATYGLVVGPKSMPCPSELTLDRVIVLEPGAYLFFSKG